MSQDNFGAFSSSPVAPATAPYAVTPHDSNELTILPKALYVGTGGTLVLRGATGTGDVTLKNVANGQVIDIRAQYVRATGTTAADIVALA